jgi:hypothetical protein
VSSSGLALATVLLVSSAVTRTAAQAATALAWRSRGTGETSIGWSTGYRGTGLRAGR